jgi:uracil phosphoribosyltransferase
VGVTTSVQVSRHPLVAHLVASLRARETRPPEFRRLVHTLSLLVAQEALADLELTDRRVETPLGPCDCRVLADRLTIVPILRAGLGMSEALIELIPEAEVWHLGMYRDEATLRPMEYYNKLPKRLEVTRALLVDPMLATGGSAVHACDLLKRAGVRRISLLALIAAPEGVARMNEAHPDVPIHVAALDERLNSVGFIHPGLGDAGDRQFNTSGREG